VSGPAVRAGILLPPRDVLPALAAEIAAVLPAYAAELGGIELLFAAPEGTPAERAAAARAFLEAEDVVALVASFTDGADAEIAAVADAAEVPLLATLSSRPRNSIAPSRWVRDLCGGIVEQSIALVRHVGAQRVALLHRDREIAEAVARRVDGVHPIDASTASLRDFDALLFAGPEAIPLGLFDETVRWPPLLFAGGAVPPSLFDRIRPDGGVWIALPTFAHDQSTAARGAYEDLIRRHGIPTGHRISQFAALTSLGLFADAARRCGGDVTRASLLRAVDDTRGFHSGLFPRLTYGAERRIGSTGAWVVGRNLDPVWID